MSTPEKFSPIVESNISSYEAAAPAQAGSVSSVAAPDPNNPPWGILAASLTWLASILFLFLMNALIVIPYALQHSGDMDNDALRQFLLTDKTAILLQIFSIIPAHLLTLGLGWAVVTRLGQRPFWKSLGWSWSGNFGLWKSLGLVVVLLLGGRILIQLIGGKETLMDQIVTSSMAARYMTAFLATFTAPLTEELIYRGLLYSALLGWFTRINAQRGVPHPQVTAAISAVTGVSLLFLLVHVPQYWPNFGVIIVIGLLSLSLTVIRAYTGRLLPCFVIHTVFNGLSAIAIVLEPYFNHPNPEQKAAAVRMLARSLG
ncbi:MAG: CPBP family intramembrane glutamic endopeptidase, partial [Pyrinomonadaceae bacterium]